MDLDFIVIDKGDFSAFRNYLNKELERWSRSVFMATLKWKQRTLLEFLCLFYRNQLKYPT
jgi:hypothetical protein